MNREGFVLLPVAIALAIVAVVAYLLVRSTAIETDMAAAEFERTKARYVAEAGLSHAIWSLNQGGCAALSGIAPTAFGAHGYQADISSGNATTYTIPVDQDTWFTESGPEMDFGTDSLLNVREDGGARERAILRYDLSAIPAESTVLSAVAHFYLAPVDTLQPVDVHRVTNDWSEGSVGWLAMSGQYDPTVLGSIPTQTASGVWVEVPLTGQVQDWYDGTHINNGIMLKGRVGGTQTSVGSRELPTTELRPWMEVVAGVLTSANVTSSGTLDSGGTGTLTRADQPVYQPTQTLALQPGAAGEDAYAWDGAHKNRNFGATSILSLDSSGAERVALLRFDLSTLPVGAEIVSATLGLYLEGGNGLTNGVIDAHSLTRAWVEGDQDDQTTTAGVTYQEAQSGTAWTSPGGDYESDTIATTTVPSLTPGWIEWDLSSAAPGWLESPGTNLGVIVRASGGTVDKINFSSGDSSTVAQHPTLTLTLRCPCGVSCGGASDPLAEGLLAHWKLDDAGGSTALDSEGGHDGTLENEPSWDTGQLDGALEFGGSDDCVDLTSDAELDDVFDGGATLTAWIRADEWGENDHGRILDKSSAPFGERDGWMLSVNGDNPSVEFAQGFTGTRGYWRSQAGTFSLDAWTHVALVYDASSAANDPVIYLDGVAQSPMVEVEPSGTLRSDASISLRMGNHAQATSRSFDGRIDDVRFYGRMLPAEEVADLVAAGGGGGGGSGCDDTYLDTFDTGDYTGSQGTLSWTGPWQEIGESDGDGDGDLTVTEDQGEQRLRIKDNDNGGEGFRREADLSGHSNATLSFDFRRESFDNANDYVTLSLSTNGSDWTEIEVFAGAATDSGYTSRSYPLLPAQISSTTQIRFLGSSSLGRNDKFWIDEVTITLSGCAP